MSYNKIYRLWFKIKIALSEKNYQKALNYIKKYMEIECAGITDELLDMYVFCNIKLNNFDEAIKYIEIINKDFPEYYDKATLAIKYIQCYKINEARKIIYNEKLSDKEYYSIGKQLILYREFGLAKTSFNKCIYATSDNNLKNKCISQMKKISKHIYEGYFLEEKYYNFKRRGEKLERGYIIYAKVEDEDYIVNDPKHDNRPYLVWKIVDDNIYCFPVTTRIDNKQNVGYVIYEQNYLNFDSDRRIKDNIAIIKESNIEKVYEKLSDEDLHCILRDLYHNIYLQDAELRNKKQEFSDDYVNELDIEIGDVILVIDKESKRRYYYFILEEDKINKGYKVIQVDNFNHYNKFDVVSDRIVYITDKTAIYSNIRLSNEEKNKLNFQALNKINLNMEPGFFTISKEKKQIVVVKNNNIYICTDKVFNSNSSFITDINNRSIFDDIGKNYNEKLLKYK